MAWIVAKNGYAADVWRCCGICREMWRWIEPGLSEEDAARVRRDHPFWQTIINLPHGRYGRTRLILAVCRKLARVEMLIAWHADVNAADKNGRTPLISASRFGHIEFVRALLNAGAGVDAAADDGSTVLMLATLWDRVEVVRALLAAGAGEDAVNSNGSTALILATNSSYGRVEVVRALLAAGANKHIINHDGRSAYSPPPSTTATIPPMRRFSRSSTSRRSACAGHTKPRTFLRARLEATEALPHRARARARSTSHAPGSARTPIFNARHPLRRLCTLQTALPRASRPLTQSLPRWLTSRPRQ